MQGNFSECMRSEHGKYSCKGWGWARTCLEDDLQAGFMEASDDLLQLHGRSARLLPNCKSVVWGEEGDGRPAQLPGARRADVDWCQYAPSRPSLFDSLQSAGPHDMSEQRPHAVYLSAWSSAYLLQRCLAAYVMEWQF